MGQQTHHVERAEQRVEGDERVTLWYFIGALAVGGAERTLVDLVNNVDRDRYDVTIWTMFDDNRLAPDVDPAIPIRTLGMKNARDGDTFVGGATNPLDYVRVPLRFVRAVRRERPDIVQSFLFLDNTVARIAGLASPETLVVTGARGLQNRTNPVVKAVDRLLIPLSDYIVSNSVSGARTYVRRGAKADRVDVVHNGRNLDAFVDASPAPLREELSIPADAPLVGMVSRLVPKKGQVDLVDAWPRVRESHPDAHLVLVGDGAERGALAARAASLGVADSVHFTGNRDDVPQVLAALDVFVFTSYSEGLSGALLEAMAAGKPIVATGIVENRELVTDGETATLVPTHAPDAVARAVVALLADPGRAAALGRAAQAEAVERFSLERMVENFEAFYESVLTD
ncbi:glycosyltransferase [Salinigranum halophilum]|jgi:glycosyltransferase involved in cell wall biosynthesis|uniref:glycosyltransferase n=1 Tax=Salinigranum halophilum TaxID=2565931 RepID=UPI00115D10E1|nr:glycosyltransferase [Salinigranum halophilum]